MGAAGICARPQASCLCQLMESRRDGGETNRSVTAVPTGECSTVNKFLLWYSYSSQMEVCCSIIRAEGQCSSHWRRLLFFVPAWGNSVLVIAGNQWQLCAEKSLYARGGVLCYTTLCLLAMCLKTVFCPFVESSSAMQHITSTNLRAYVLITMTSRIPAFVSRCRSTCMLSVWLCLIGSPSFSLSGLWDKALQNRGQFQPQVSTGGFAVKSFCSHPG